MQVCKSSQKTQILKRTVCRPVLEPEIMLAPELDFLDSLWLKPLPACLVLPPARCLALFIGPVPDCNATCKANYNRNGKL